MFLLLSALCLLGAGKAIPMQQPTFLQGLNQSAVQEYYQIKQNQNATIRQQKLDESNWANRNGVSKEWNDYQTNETQREEQLQVNITRVINQLAGVNQQLQQIQQNQDQTPAARQQAIKNFKNETGVAAKILLDMPKYFKNKGEHHDDDSNSNEMMRGPARANQGMPMMMNQQGMNQPMTQQYNQPQGPYYQPPQGQFNPSYNQANHQYGR